MQWLRVDQSGRRIIIRPIIVRYSQTVDEMSARSEIISRLVVGGLHHDYQRQTAARPSLPRAA
jgi:hypothetical protein